MVRDGQPCRPRPAYLTPPGRVPSGVAGDGVGEDCWLVAWARWEAKGA
jgi:hypothetical protein